jgi:hypothetical protein
VEFEELESKPAGKKPGTKPDNPYQQLFEEPK